MTLQFPVLSAPILLALSVSLLILAYVAAFYRDRRGDPVVVLYFWITVATVVWTGFSSLKLLHTVPAIKLLFYRLLHVGAAALPPLILLFVVALTDRDRWLRYDTVGAVFLLPAAFVALLFVGPDGLVTTGTQLVGSDIVVLRVTDGPVFVLFSVYSTFLVVATLGLVLSETRRVGPAFYPQAALLAVAVVVPMLFSVLTTADLAPFDTEGANLVPTSAAVSVVIFGVLLYRYRLVDLPPLAYATGMKYSPDALFVLDRQGRVVTTNQHGTELLEAVGGTVGSPLSGALPAFDAESTSNDLLDVAHPSGEVTYFRVFAEPLTRGGRRLGWVAVLRDETVQQRQQEQLRTKNEQMDVFASTISHDLRNPLNVAALYLELAREESDSEELAKVANAHDRMEAIIEEVLTLARAGKRIDTLETVRIGDVAERAWANVATRAAALTVATDRTVMGNPAMIQRLLENLFRNAVEHGGEDVTVTVADCEDGVAVEDDGVGIPPADRESVFEAGNSGETGGTGLGLSIVEQVVDAHGWDVRVTEGRSRGARFEITGLEAARRE